MKIIIISVLAGLSILSMSSCMDLDKEPLDIITGNKTFEDEALTMAYINPTTIYRYSVS